MDQTARLLHLTNQLREHVEFSVKRYEESRKSNEKADFYEEIKPFADEVKRVSDEWSALSIQWINSKKPKNLYPQQIESACEHMETISVQAFFPETSKTRFKNLVSSSLYILSVLTNLIKNETKEP